MCHAYATPTELLRLLHYKSDLLQGPTLAAAMCDPTLVYREKGIFECTGGLAAFRELLDLRCGYDHNKKADIMAALAAMRRQHSKCLYVLALQAAVVLLCA